MGIIRPQHRSKDTAMQPSFKPLFIGTLGAFITGTLCVTVHAQAPAPVSPQASSVAPAPAVVQDDRKERDTITDRRLFNLEDKLSKLERALEDVARQSPVLDCRTVTKFSEPLLRETSLTVEDAPAFTGYTLVAGTCSYVDAESYERPLLLVSSPVGNTWQCAYRSSRPGKIKGTATFCRATMSR